MTTTHMGVSCTCGYIGIVFVRARRRFQGRPGRFIGNVSAPDAPEPRPTERDFRAPFSCGSTSGAAAGQMEFHIPGCRPEPPKRVNSLSIHLTYAGLHRGELTFETVLTAARRWGAARGGLREYVIGREKHTQPANAQRDEHFHCYFKYGKAIDVRDRLHTTVFNLCGQGARVLARAASRRGQSSGATSPSRSPSRCSGLAALSRPPRSELATRLGATARKARAPPSERTYV